MELSNTIDVVKKLFDAILKLKGCIIAQGSFHSENFGRVFPCISIFLNPFRAVWRKASVWHKASGAPKGRVVGRPDLMHAARSLAVPSYFPANRKGTRMKFKQRGGNKERGFSVVAPSSRKL